MLRWEVDVARRQARLDLTNPLASLSQALRDLRDSAGPDAPPVAEVAERSGLPRSTLYAALRGNRLPSREVVAALARAWGGDESDWLRARSAAENAIQAESDEQ